jgi:hypothetical protein
VYADAWPNHEQHYKKVCYNSAWYCTANQRQAKETAAHTTAKLKTEGTISKVIYYLVNNILFHSIQFKGCSM